MSKHSFNRESHEEINFLLQAYQSLKDGNRSYLFNEEEFEKIANHFESKEQFKEAVEVIDIALTFYPSSIEFLLIKVDLLMSGEQTQEALYTLDHIQPDLSDSLTYYLLKTEVYLIMGNKVKAIESYQTLMSLPVFAQEDALDKLLEMVELFEDYECINETFEVLKQILKIQPVQEEALCKLSFWIEYSKKYDESILFHKELITQQPYNVLAWFNLGLSYHALKRYEEAIEAYEYCIVIKKEFDYPYQNIADIHIKKKRYREAIEILQALMDISVAQITKTIYYSIATCYTYLKEYDQARSYYLKYIDLYPQDYYVHYRIGYSYIEEKNWENALKYITQALTLKPHYVYANIAMCEILIQKKSYYEALTYAGVAIHYKPSLVNGWVVALHCLFELQQYDDAIHFALHSIKVTKSKKPILLYFLATALILAKKEDEGMYVFKNAIEQFPRLMAKFIKSHPNLIAHTPMIASLVIQQNKNKKKKKQ